MERNWAEYFYPQGVSEEDKIALEAVRKAFRDAAVALQNEHPAGRYKSLVLTKLEEAAMFATKSFTHK